MLGAATVVFLGAVGLLVLAWWRRDRPGLPFFGEREDIARKLVLLFGIAIPLAVLVALFGGPTSTRPAHRAPDPRHHGDDDRRDRASVVVGGALPGHGRAITANEIHIPVGTRVNVVATTADVIHSFWVPAAGPQDRHDPGRCEPRCCSTPRGRASTAGSAPSSAASSTPTWRSTVVAQPAAAFRAWLAGACSGRPAPRRRGRAAGRAAVHEQRSARAATRSAGTAAHGTVGPDLTHLAHAGRRSPR